ncbi:hypothetical protein [Pseudoclavibacter sp. AY1F1]|uniref:hypothetical protein n=1 Tax=Pseudoclavibacter sp. AY1F1 TaxID=2080583 RepID=UPI0011B049B2|nr:hypothetical protein [Pseudoclavibacter sp. AY1F1]
MTTLALAGCTADSSVSTDPSSTAATSSEASATPTSTPTVLPALTLEQFMTAEVPSLCEQPAGALVDGQLPGIDRANGIVVLQAKTAMTDGTDRDPLTLVAINPTPMASELAGLAAFRCDKGGVEWPAQLVGYDADMNVLGSVNPSDLSKGPKDYAWNLVWDDTSDETAQRVTFDWASHYYPEPSARGSLRTTGTVSFDTATRELVIETPPIFEATALAGEYFTAIQNQDWATVQSMTTDPQVSSGIQNNEQPQLVLTLDWSSEKRAICLPPEHEEVGEYGAQQMQAMGASFYCTSSSQIIGEVHWMPGVYVGQDSSGAWKVTGVQLYAD